VNKIVADISMFVLLLSLLFLPVGSFGLAEVKNAEKEVLSIKHIRTEMLDVVDESTESSEEEVIPFYR